ncbi:arrestin domain-containing protein 17-like [Dendronephthya gigantea]|uniref:arrestin domain-containing protein 17-like n=1 Tax=Dendronephthya gigantea TaxID=151771 RepID=UPI00106C6015|nr:arrestin domain-containing protein 17-like [Dendronephthya gigantea]
MDVKPEVNITFEEQPAVFFVGKEAINGDVSISVTKLMKTQMIKVEFKGICQVGWTKRGVSDKKHKSVEHFKIEDKLLTPRSEYNDLFLRSGTHRFPFSFKLPQAMPPTFTAKDAKIEYFARVVVHYRDDGSMVSSEICAEAPLVMKKSIANFPEKFLKSAKLKQQLTLPKMFSRSTRVEVEAMIPKRVYHRGEIIRLTCDYKILNGSVNGVTGISAVLMQGLTVVKANGHEKTKTREILRAPPFQGHNEETTKWSDTYMNIPADISLTVQGCGDVTIFYFIQVRAKNSKERIDIPVVIIDRDESKVINPGSKRRERRLSLTGTTSGSAIPNVFQTFNALSRQDPTRASRNSIDSFYRD